MKAMMTGFAASALIAVGAWYTLNQIGFSSAEVYSSPGSVRLD
ncbi:hypothetical protein [Citreimonas salinaria]|uniref:Uncharacterized protein n=1 Tax=Citreimonas salinaria TaxID=321339 RepID=A0A1H3F0X8_9RHOB|nr:hypothetical protein [Citreimonas salinaria]SDX84560.1 hypothetical protein SAMN05444340_101109 [Citreimonas salinaria]